MSFYDSLTLDELAIEQGVKPFDIEKLTCSGACFWEDADDFESFLHGIYETCRLRAA